VAKCRALLNVIRMLKGTSWGAGKRPLLIVYRSLVRSAVDGMEAYFFESPSLLKPLQKIQNDALRMCTGALVSIAVICLHHACNEMPLNVKHKFLCLKFEAHLLSFSDHPALSLTEDYWQERFPDSPGFCSFNMFTKTEVDQSIFAAAPVRIPNIPPWSIRKPVIDLTLLQFVRQKASAFVAPVFSSHLHNLYDQFVKIYTDGSKTSERAGCGVYIADRNLRYSITINKLSSSINSELFAILHVLYLAYSLKIIKVVVATDSLSPLQSITDWNWKKHSFANKLPSSIPHSQHRDTRSLSFGFRATKTSQEMKLLTNWQNSPLPNRLQSTQMCSLQTGKYPIEFY